MAIYVYPENYTEPPVPPEVVLTPEQRATVKAGMQTHVTNNGKMLVRVLIDFAQDYIRQTWGVHIPDQTLEEIALEIREAWGYPGQGEE
jgi:hypothetical protein